jgi:hypothetical protein
LKKVKHPFRIAHIQHRGLVRKLRQQGQRLIAFAADGP